MFQQTADELRRRLNSPTDFSRSQGLAPSLSVVAEEERKRREPQTETDVELGCSEVFCSVQSEASGSDLLVFAFSILSFFFFFRMLVHL